jgi:hypothetical protein
MTVESNVGMMEGQMAFLQQGGRYQIGLRKMRASGNIVDFPEFKEYPKMIRLIDGTEEVACSTEIGNGSTRKNWIETREIVREILVHSEEEEERVLAGGKTSAQVEQDRQALIARCRSAGIRVDPTWSAIRLRRELGEKLDAPEPVDKMAALSAELDNLRKIAAMQAEIDALKARMSASPLLETDDLRGQLTTLGVKVDGRWSEARMREELEKATAPEAA